MVDDGTERRAAQEVFLARIRRELEKRRSALIPPLSSLPRVEVRPMSAGEVPARGGAAAGALLRPRAARLLA